MAKFRKPRMRSYEALMKKSEKELKRTYKKLYKQVYNQRRYLKKKGEAVDWKFDESYKAVRGNKSSYAAKIIKLIERQRLQTYTAKGINKMNKNIASNFKYNVDRNNNYYKIMETGETYFIPKDKVTDILNAWHDLVSDGNFIYAETQYEDLLTEAVEKGWDQLSGKALSDKMEMDIKENFRKAEEAKIKAYKSDRKPFAM